MFLVLTIGLRIVYTPQPTCTWNLSISFWRLGSICRSLKCKYSGRRVDKKRNFLGSPRSSPQWPFLIFLRPMHASFERLSHVYKPGMLCARLCLCISSRVSSASATWHHCRLWPNTVRRLHSMSGLHHISWLCGIMIWISLAKLVYLRGLEGNLKKLRLSRQSSAHMSPTGISYKIGTC